MKKKDEFVMINKTQFKKLFDQKVGRGEWELRGAYFVINKILGIAQRSATLAEKRKAK